MERRTYLQLAGGAVGGAFAGCTGDGTTPADTDDQIREDDDGDDGAADDTDDADDRIDEEDPGEVRVETVADGLEHPWGVAFVPDTPWLLVTERDASRLSLLDREDGTLEYVEGTPDAFPGGQGGLLDVTLHPDGTWVYLTYASANDADESTTHVGRGRLDLEEPRLEDFETLFVAEPYAESTGHYGSRVVFGPDGMVYVTVGDRQFKDFGPDHVSQDTSNPLGSTVRLAPDGSIPADNPFVDEEGFHDAIFSYGHRNAQGMTVHPETDEIWQTEHGERDGDEINILERGGNYGWPVAHYGCEYGTEEPVGDLPEERDDIVNPVHYWPCTSGGFPPAGATFYDAETVGSWRGDLFVGNLAGEYLARFTVDGRNVEETERLLADQGWRIRAVEVAPDTGHLYVAVDAEEAPIVRLIPG